MIDKDYKTVNGMTWETIHVKTPDIDITLLNYGARVLDLKTKDKDGNFESIVLKYHHLEDYISGGMHMNASIGPIAGRVKHGELPIHDTLYHLTKNFNDKHTLHGGDDAFTYQLFQSSVKEDGDATIITYFHPIKKDAMNPANVMVRIQYVIRGNSLTINFTGEADADSFLNLTNHMYFNLSGNAKSGVKDQVMRLAAKERYHLDQDLIATHAIKAKDAYDFTTPKPIGEALSKIDGGIDDIYILDQERKQPAFTAYNPISSRQMTCHTDYETCVLYTHNNINDNPLWPLKSHPLHHAFCVEFQHKPHHLGDNLVNVSKDTPYINFIKYTFTTTD